MKCFRVQLEANQSWHLYLPVLVIANLLGQTTCSIQYKVLKICRDRRKTVHEYLLINPVFTFYGNETACMSYILKLDSRCYCGLYRPEKAVILIQVPSYVCAVCNSLVLHK
jgi:hypothetical protein